MAVSMRLQVENVLTVLTSLACTPIPQNDVMLAVAACAPDVLSSMASTMVAAATVQIAAAKARTAWHSLGPNDSMPARSEAFVTRFDVFIVVLKQLFGVALSVQQRRRGTQADFGFAFVNYTTRNRDALLGSWSVVRFSL